MRLGVEILSWCLMNNDVLFSTLSGLELADCHLHLQDPKFAGQVEQVITRASAAGVTRMFCNGLHEGDWPQVLALAQKYSALIPFFGIHPWYCADRSPEWLSRLREHLAMTPSGVGEIGLDRACRVPLAEQLAVFQLQLALARELCLPVTIHCVRAWGKLREALAVDGPHRPGLILHGYGGPAELVEAFAALGGYFSISFAGLANESLVARIPAERLLLETDAPDRCPPPELVLNRELARQGINEPANLDCLYGLVASLRGVTPENLARQVGENIRKLTVAQCGEQSRRSGESHFKSLG